MEGIAERSVFFEFFWNKKGGLSLRWKFKIKPIHRCIDSRANFADFRTTTESGTKSEQSHDASSSKKVEGESSDVGSTETAVKTNVSTPPVEPATTTTITKFLDVTDLSFSNTISA
eukprot:GHVP01049161.1.p1 GENE.GHVP01049161.1~~GHVP01049161.1.p1  ORF type:complete len:116 (+),score=20.65 GHVP01049161.1:147-494(+)